MHSTRQKFTFMIFLVSFIQRGILMPTNGKQTLSEIKENNQDNAYDRIWEPLNEIETDAKPTSNYSPAFIGLVCIHISVFSILIFLRIVHLIWKICYLRKSFISYKNLRKEYEELA